MKFTFVTAVALLATFVAAAPAAAGVDAHQVGHLRDFSASAELQVPGDHAGEHADRAWELFKHKFEEEGKKWEAIIEKIEAKKETIKEGLEAKWEAFEHVFETIKDKLEEKEREKWEALKEKWDKIKGKHDE